MQAIINTFTLMDTNRSKSASKYYLHFNMGHTRIIHKDITARHGHNFFHR